MIVTSVKIKFPVMLYSSRRIRGRIRNADELLIVGKENLNKGCFQDSMLIDATGNEFVIMRAIESKTDKVSFWKSLTRSFRVVKVDLEFSDPKQLTLEEAKEIIIHSMYGEGRHIVKSQVPKKDLIKAVNEAKDFEELVNVISYKNIRGKIEGK